MPVWAHHLHALTSFSVNQDTVTSSQDKVQILVVLPCSKTGKRVASQDQFPLSYCMFHLLFPQRWTAAIYIASFEDVYPRRLLSLVISIPAFWAVDAHKSVTK